MRSPRPEITVVKLGGSHAGSPHLRRWLEAIAAEAGAIVVVPGGGPFADAVRQAQALIGFDDVAAHEMAMMAMAQFGRALQSLNSSLRPAHSLAAVRRVLKERKVPVWAPERMARAASRTRNPFFPMKRRNNGSTTPRSTRSRAPTRAG